MPMGNGTGPNGMGPRTGRGAGYCNGFNMPGAYNRGAGLGGGRGFGRGGGFGFGNRFGGRGGFGFYGGTAPGFGAGYAPQQLSKADYSDMLRDEAEYLENRLNALRDELKKAEKDSE